MPAAPSNAGCPPPSPRTSPPTSPAPTAAIAGARTRNAEVAAWKLGGQRPQAVQPAAVSGTFSALIARYRREVLNGKRPDGSPRLREKTRAVYETGLKRLEAWAGKHPLAFITPARVRALRDATARPVEAGGLGHASAFNLLRLLRQVMAFAENVDLIAKGSNPARNFDLAAPPPRRRIWKAEHEAAFIAAAYELNMPSMALAIELALFTAQREGDLIGFTEPQLNSLDIFDRRMREFLAGEDGTVKGWTFEQGKTSNQYAAREMAIPLSAALLAKVAAVLRTNRARDRARTPPVLISHVLVDDRTGLPWKQRAFISAWAMIRDHAATRTGLEDMRDLVWHDLRRTRVVRLRRQGMPKEMIGALTGHDPKSIDEILKVYGPIDPTITAAAIVSALEHEQATADREEAAGKEQRA
jgi:hypothetical protein